MSAARENRNAVVGTREKDTKVAVCSGRLRRTTYLLALILALVLMIPPFFPLLRHAEEIVIPTMPPTESRFEDSDYEEDLVKARDRQAEQLRQMEAQMAALKNENALLQAKIGEVSAESEAVRQAYDQIKAELAQAAEALEAAIKEYTEAVAESRAKFKEYTERLSAMFYLRRQSLLEVVLSAGDITGVYTCLRLRAIIARDDKKALDNLNSAVAVAESLRYAAENTKSEYEEYVRLKQKELTALEEGLAQLAEEKRTHDAQLLSRGDALEDLRNEHEGVQEDLDQFYADKAKYEEARRLLEKLREEKIAEKSSIAASRSESASIAESIRAAESSRAEESRIAESIRRLNRGEFVGGITAYFGINTPV